MRDRKFYDDSPEEDKCVNKIIKVLETLNPQFDWQESLPDGWYDNLDPLMTVEENLSNLQRLFGGRGVRLCPHEEIAGPRQRKEMEKRLATHLDEDGLLQMSDEEIKPHKTHAKGHEYLNGRIQILIRKKELIGQKARVLIFIPGAYQILYPPQPSKPNSSR